MLTATTQTPSLHWFTNHTFLQENPHPPGGDRGVLLIWGSLPAGVLVRVLATRRLLAEMLTQKQVLSGGGGSDVVSSGESHRPVSSGESHRPPTSTLLKSIAIQLPLVSRCFLQMSSGWLEALHTPPISITIRLPLVTQEYSGQGLLEHPQSREQPLCQRPCQHPVSTGWILQEMHQI